MVLVAVSEKGYIAFMPISAFALDYFFVTTCADGAKAVLECSMWGVFCTG